MRVISFHSYKGGRGRTTAIASIANLYARGGKNVALLDADVTAPWLHTRYEVSADDLRSRGWLRGLLRRIAETPPSILPAADLDDYSIRVDGVEGGSIRLLAPGDPETDDYWSWMAEEFPRFLGVRAEPHIVESWRDLRALIAQAEPRPDLLLVDAPAGYHQASAYMAMAIADTAVLFAQADHADALWTTQMVEMIRKARPEDAADRYGDLRVLGVRARYPGYIDADVDAAERFSGFKERYAEAEFDQWASLESDPLVEFAEFEWDAVAAGRDHEVPIPPQGQFLATPLVEGYAELLAASLGEEPATGAQLLAELPEGSVIPGPRPQFFLLREQGVLMNPADRTRNVSFRVETFCALLDDLHRELIGSSVADTRLGEEATTPSALELAGRKPGGNFGASLAVQIGEREDSPGDRERIQRWCEFDSRVGFGGLALERIDQDPAGNATAGAISVAGNFLAAGRRVDEGDLDLCPLLSGYVAGVLSKLLRSMPEDIKVAHPADRCMGHSERTSCEFDFVVPGDT